MWIWPVASRDIRKAWIRREGHWRLARTPLQGTIVESSYLQWAGAILFLWCFCSICWSRRLRELYREVHERHPLCSAGGQPDHQPQVLHSSVGLLPHLPGPCHWRHSLARNCIWNAHYSFVVLVHKPGMCISAQVCAWGRARENLCSSFSSHRKALGSSFGTQTSFSNQNVFTRRRKSSCPVPHPSLHHIPPKQTQQAPSINYLLFITFLGPREP